MTRADFDKEFRPMCQALQVKVVGAQADYFFHEFHGADPRDFAHACRELAMGNPGYLPKLAFFRENVQAAREMRVEQEKQARSVKESRFLDWAPGRATSSGDPGDEQYAPVFAKCCAVRMKCGREDLPTAQRFLQETLKDSGFEAWTKSWSTHGGMVAYDWLWAQMRGETTLTPRHSRPRH